VTNKSKIIKNARFDESFFYNLEIEYFLVFHYGLTAKILKKTFALN
jgi:hypothetical protein